MTRNELESAWKRLQPPDDGGEVNGTRIAGLPLDRPAYMAVDNEGFRYLLIQVPEDTPPIEEKTTRSLEVTSDHYVIGSNREAFYISLKCLDRSQNETFNAVVEDIVRFLSRKEIAPRDSVLDSLARWQAFWTTRQEALGRDDALGLFGELWFLSRWIGLRRPDVINNWQATKQARHDFQWPKFSVEVKTSAIQTAGPPVHHIASLEQLAAPESGTLFLFSLQVKEDSLSANTLHGMVGHVREAIAGNFEADSLFLEKLANRHYSVNDQGNAQRPFRVIAERLYSVDEAFPRLVSTSFGPGGPPAGVCQVSYDLDLTACANWLYTTNPEDSKKVFNIDEN